VCDFVTSASDTTFEARRRNLDADRAGTGNWWGRSGVRRRAVGRLWVIRRPWQRGPTFPCAQLWATKSASATKSPRAGQFAEWSAVAESAWGWTPRRPAT